MNLELFKQYKETYLKRKELKAELSELEGTIDQLKTLVIDEMLKSDVDAIKVAGKNFSQTNTVFAKVVDKEKAIEVLRTMGLDDLISPNYNSLSSFIRDYLKMHGKLPPEFDGIIEPFNKKNISLRNA